MSYALVIPAVVGLCALATTNIAADCAAQPTTQARQVTEALRPPLVVDAPPAHIRPDLGPPGSLGPLPQHGNINGGTDLGYTDVGIIYAIRLYTGNFVDSVSFAWYVPSNNSDNIYRSGDKWGSTPQIGDTRGTDRGWYYCPQGYVAVGLQGASGTAAVDRLGLICGQLEAPAHTFTLPMFGGTGGSVFNDTCQENGFMTGVRVRSGDWMDSVQGLCRAAH
jgi:hypothetical protein